MPRVTVVGAGNALVEHDRVGPAVVRELRSLVGEEVEVCELRGDGLALLDLLRGQELLVVVDACALGGEPGAVEVLDLQSLRARVATGRGTTLHQIGPDEVLRVAEALFPETLPLKVLVVLVETGGLGDPELAQTQGRVIELVRTLIGSLDD